MQKRLANTRISLVDDVRFQALVSWNPAGTSFLIRNVKKFAQIVLPEYFKHGNFSSFVRLLNMYVTNVSLTEQASNALSA